MVTITADEYSLLRTPLSELLERGLLKSALHVREKIDAYNRNENAIFKPAFSSSPYVISDQLGNTINGLINHADGKRYDSKSAFEKSVRAKGCRIVGNDFNKTEYKTPIERGVRGDFNVRPQLKQSLEKVLSQ